VRGVRASARAWRWWRRERRRWLGRCVVVEPGRSGRRCGGGRTARPPEVLPALRAEVRGGRVVLPAARARGHREPLTAAILADVPVRRRRRPFRGAPAFHG